MIVGQIHGIELIPVTETVTPELQGFFVRGFKRTSCNKIGFLLNSIRTLNIEEQGLSAVQLRISWLLHGKAMEIEERGDQTRRRTRTASDILFRVTFDDLDHPVVVSGQPRIVKGTFTGKSVEISWLPRARRDRTIIVIKALDSNAMICKLARKKKSIAIQIVK
ncbi:MAG: hypothetical protein ACFFD4_17905 [Candidatus Odinarchaeota archaeon]